MSKEDFVTPEIAKLLKEKGYKVSDNSYKRVIRNGEKVAIVTVDPKYDNIYKDELLPHLYDVHKWLIKEHNIYIEIMHIYLDTEKNHINNYWGMIKKLNETSPLEYSTDYNTFAEALNGSIKLALKYI